MASVWRHPKSKYWSVCYDLPDGRRVKESVKLTSKSKAMSVAGKLETEARAGLNERKGMKLAAELHEKYGMTEPRAVEIASRLCERLGGRSLKTSTVAEFAARWIERKKAETGAATAKKYGEAARHFLAFLGPAAARRDIGSVDAREIAEFRDDLARRLAVGTVNITLKIVRILFADALRSKLISHNEAADVPTLKQSGEKSARRAFTADELRSVLKAAGPEWRAMILAGFYTGGQRIGDVARLTWQNVDMEAGEIRLVTRKTGRTQIMPIAPALLSALTALPASDDPKAPLFAHARARLTASKGEHVGALSNEFHEILVAAGLATAHVHHRTGEGRGGRRKVGELGFHSLRHTFTSWAKSVGIGDAVVRDMVGHESKAISAAYTHIDEATKRAAVARLPDLSA